MLKYTHRNHKVVAIENITTLYAHDSRNRNTTLIVHEEGRNQVCAARGRHQLTRHCVRHRSELKSVVKYAKRGIHFVHIMIAPFCSGFLPETTRADW